MLRRYVGCLVVRDLILFNNLNRTQALFGLSKGVLQSIQMAYKVFFHMNLKVLKALHYDFLYEVFKSFETDITAELTPEALAFVNQGVWAEKRVNDVGGAEVRSDSDEQRLQNDGGRSQGRPRRPSADADRPSAVAVGVLQGGRGGGDRKRVGVECGNEGVDTTSASIL